jgi:hypothetical protein
MKTAMKSNNDKKPGTEWYNSCPINTRMRIKRAMESQNPGMSFTQLFPRLDFNGESVTFKKWLFRAFDFEQTIEKGEFWLKVVSVYENTGSIPESDPIDKIKGTYFYHIMGPIVRKKWEENTKNYDRFSSYYQSIGETLVDTILEDTYIDFREFIYCSFNLKTCNEGMEYWMHIVDFYSQGKDLNIKKVEFEFINKQ